MLASIYKHIYRGCNDVAYCPPYTLASWDSLQRTKMLCEEQRCIAAWSSHKNAPRAKRRRSRGSSRCCSRMLSHRGWSGYSCCSPPNTPPRCHCGEPLSPSSNTTPKLSSAMSVPAYARSSCLWLHGSGTSRCKGRACAHLLPLPSTSASFLLMRRQRGCGRATLVHGLLPHSTAGGQGGPQKKMGGKEGSPRN